MCLRHRQTKDRIAAWKESIARLVTSANSWRTGLEGGCACGHALSLETVPTIRPSSSIRKAAASVLQRWVLVFRTLLFVLIKLNPRALSCDAGQGFAGTQTK